MCLPGRSEFRFEKLSCSLKVTMGVAMDVFAARVPFTVSRYQQARDWCANHISTGWEFGGFVSAALMEFLFRCEADAALFKKHWAEIVTPTTPLNTTS
jgi:hypothetical protein